MMYKNTPNRLIVYHNEIFLYKIVSIWIKSCIFALSYIVHSRLVYKIEKDYDTGYRHVEVFLWLLFNKSESSERSAATSVDIL